MQFTRLKKTFRKRLRAQQKQVEFLGEATEKSIERNVFRRFSRLLAVKRFVFGWVLLMVLLMGISIAQFQHLSTYYQTTQPVSGGIYSEGMVGSISNVNPLYATSDVDRSLSRLLFAGLLGYDHTGKLIPVLAERYAASDNGRTFTVTMKPGLRWQDGQPLTADDVAFTYNMIKNPDAQSPLLSTWQRVSISAPNKSTVVFKLPSALASFPYNLTTGLVPKHILGGVSAGALRSNDFNTTKPVGAGPFKWRGLQVSGDSIDNTEEQVALLPNNSYVLGKPKLAEFISRVYGSTDNMQRDFAGGQLTAIAGVDAVPSKLPDNAQVHSLILKAGTYVFFKVSNPTLSSTAVRKALVAASNPAPIINKLGYDTRPVTEPLLLSQLAFDKKYAQQTNDLTTAKTLLANDGWQLVNGVQRKGNASLKFNLVVADTPEYRGVAEQLRQQWRQIGAQVSVQPLQISDYATALADHDYDATLHGIEIGTDPDVYAYWDSAQADVRATSRLNLSEWKNPTADQALESGRSRLGDQLRTIKYAPFLQAWQQDAPALGLYQPRSIYISNGPVYGLTDRSISSNIDRYNGVERWQIRSSRVTAK